MTANLSRAGALDRIPPPGRRALVVSAQPAGPGASPSNDKEAPLDDHAAEPRSDSGAACREPLTARGQARAGLTPPNNRYRYCYADPPYLGCCAMYDHRHQAPYGCWNELDTHITLIEHLAEFDGWALSLTSKSLRDLLPLCPADVRVAAWVKTWTPFNAANPAFAWEPVIFRTQLNGTARGGKTSITIRDWHAGPTAKRNAKPITFCRWVANLLGVTENDELIDLFPGSYAMTRTLAQGVLL